MSKDKDLNRLNILPTNWKEVREKICNDTYMGSLEFQTIILTSLREEKDKEMATGIFENEEEWYIMYQNIKHAIEKFMDKVCLSTTIRGGQLGGIGGVKTFLSSIEKIILNKSEYYIPTFHPNTTDILQQIYTELFELENRNKILETKVDTLCFMMEGIWKMNMDMKEILEFSHTLPVGEDSFSLAPMGESTSMDSIIYDHAI